MDSKNQTQKREIKFRAWCSGTHGNVTFNEPLMEYGIVLSRDGYYCDVEGEWDIQKILPTIPVMQFTGLHDKNGVPIYEGDLLNIGANDFGYVTNSNKEFCNYEVRVEGCDYILKRSDLDFNWGKLSRVEELGWECEVRGNVFEHPNLLK